MNDEIPTPRILFDALGRVRHGTDGATYIRTDNQDDFRISHRLAVPHKSTVAIHIFTYDTEEADS